MADTEEDVADIDDLLLWCDEAFGARIHIQMGMTRLPKKSPLPYANGVLPTFNQFRPGRDADYEGQQSSTGKPLWGIEDHEGNWDGMRSRDSVHAVFPHLHEERNFFIFDADPGPGKIWKDKKGVLEWLKRDDYAWLLECPYTETKAGYHFYFRCDDDDGNLPPRFPLAAKKMFSAITDDSVELFGGTSWSPDGPAKVWVWEENKRTLFNWKDEIVICAQKRG